MIADNRGLDLVMDYDIINLLCLPTKALKRRLTFLSKRKIFKIEEYIRTIYFPLQFQLSAATKGEIVGIYDMATIYIAYEYASRSLSKIDEKPETIILFKLFDKIRKFLFYRDDNEEVEKVERLVYLKPEIPC